jgi:hypothetical protein
MHKVNNAEYVDKNLPNGQKFNDSGHTDVPCNFKNLLTVKEIYVNFLHEL